MRRGLYLQVVLSLSAGLVASVAPVGWWIGRSQSRLYVDTIRENALVVARSQAENAAHFLLIAEYAGLEQQLKDAALLPDVVSLRLFEPDGTQLAHVRRDAPDAPPRVAYGRERGQPPSGSGPIVREEGGRLVVWAPVVAGKPLGWLQITYSLRSVEVMRGAIWRQALLVGAVWIAVAVLIVTLLLRRPMSAIRELSLFARDLPRRKGERVPPGRRHDEIRLLAEALDHASVELAETERQHRDLEAQLRHSQKMEAIGLLAGGIAHDFNNILTGILGDASLLREGTGPADPRRESIEEIEEAARRATALTRGLLAFSRKQRMELRPTDLNEVVRDLGKMLRRIIGEEIALRTELCAAPLVANADAAQVEQVLVNLAANARDAMPGGGVLQVTTSVVTEAPEGAPEVPLPAALVTVSDTGAGMDVETLQKIFEPFFTTKAVGKGTGLGLSIVHGIVQQHGGAVKVQSVPGVGTTFRIFLPLSRAESAAAATPAGARPAGGTERILIVEDEPPVRSVMRRILSNAGYGVVEAADGREALERLAVEGERFQLVVSDVVMPNLTGRELRDALRARHPGLPLLFVSGYTADSLAGRLLPDGAVDLLLKPFTGSELLARVRAALDRRAPPERDPSGGA